MKKNTLLSILAISSTSVAAYADAFLDVIKTDATTDWSNASEGIDLADGIFTSTVPMSQTIGTLVKGQYTLTAETNNNAKFTINGKDYELGTTFDISEETQVTIGISAASATVDGGQFKVGGFKLTLVYDFEAAKSVLTQKLSSVIGKSVNVWGTEEPDDKGKNLLLEASGIASKLNALADDKENSYDIYKDNKLYLGADNAELPFNKQISELNTKMEANAANTMAYNYVMENYVEVVSGEIASLAEAIENSNSEYVKEKYTSTHEEYVNSLNAYKAALDAAFKDGNAVEAYPTEAVDEAVEALVKELEDLEKVVSTAADADPAYIEIKGKIDEARANSAALLRELNELMADEVYANLLSQARVEINEQNVEINKADKLNGTEAEHDAAAVNKVENIATLTAVNDKLSEIKTEYENRVASIAKAYADATALVEGLENQYKTIDNEDVQEKFAEELGAFAKRISDFKETVEVSHADYTVDNPEVIASQRATADKITSDINTFVNGPAKTIIDNFNNYHATKETIDGYQKALDDAKKAVSELKVEKDESYNAAAKFKATAKALQGVLDNYRVEAKNVYDANYKDGKLDLYEPDPAYKDTGDEIANYQSTAEAIVDHLNEVLVAVEEGKAALDALKKEAVDTDVTVLNGEGTYGSNISALTKYYEEIEKKVAEANELLDAEHAEAVKKITVDGDKKTLAETLTEKYSDAKAEYDKTVNINAAQKMLAQAQLDVNSCNDAYEALVEKTDGKLGKSQTAFDGELTAEVATPLKDLQTKISSVGEINESNALEAIALLKEANETIGNIRTAIFALDNKANEIFDSLKEIADAKAAVEKDLTEVKEQLNGNSDKKLDGVSALNKDDSKSEYFQAKVDNVTTSISELEAEMKESAEEETFMTDQDDKLSEAGEVETKGFKTRVKELGEEVQNLRAEAEQATRNFNSKTALVNLYGAGEGNLDIRTKINNAKDVIAGDEVTGDGAEYFNKLVEDIQEEFDNIIAEIEKDYKDNKLNKSETTITSKLNDLEKRVSAVPGNAVNNDKAYKDLSEYVDEVQSAWDAAYIEISANYQQIDLDQILNGLTAEQTNLTAVKKDVAGAWGNGTCHDDQVSLKDELNKISNEIANILKSTKEGYDTAIAKDNQTRYDAFLKAIDEANNERIIAIRTINEYNYIQNIAYEELIVPIRENHQAIFEYAEKIADLKQKALDEKNAATNNHADGDKAFYDVEEENKALAESYTEEIKEILESFRTEVEELAASLYNNEIKKAKEALAAAEKVLNDAEYDKDVVSKAFGDVRTIISDAETARKGVDFPLALDKILTNFGTIYEKIEAGYELAALSEWRYCYGKIKEMIDDEQTEMAKFEYLPSNTVDYDKKYADEVIANRDAAIKIATEAESLFGENLAAAKAELDKIFVEIVSVDGKDVEHTAVYNGAANASKDNAENLAAIDKINGFLDVAQKRLNEAKVFIDAMLMRNDGYVVEAVDIVQTQINDTRKKVADYAQYGGAANQVEGIENKFVNGQIKDLTAALYRSAIEAEKDELGSQIDLLKKDYNNATTDPDITLEELKQLKDRMDALPEALDKVDELVDEDKNPLYNEQQKECIRLEFEIADIQDSLVYIYDKGASYTSTLNSLNSALDAVKEAADEQSEVLAGCHENVQNVYSDQLAAIQAELEAISADIAENAKNKTILFYADNISKDIAAAQENLQALAEKIANDQKPYTINQEAYERLSNELEALRSRKADLEVTIENYKYLSDDLKDLLTSAEPTVTFKGNLVQIEKLITEAEKALNDSYDEISLKEDSKLKDVDNINENLDLATKFAAHSDIYDGSISVLPTMLRQINGYRSIDSRRYTEESNIELNKIYNSIDFALKALNQFDENVYNKGYTNVDIDGKYFFDETGENIINKTYADYINDVMPLTTDKIADIENQIAEFENKVESEYYILGDITKDNNVYVDDYMGIIDLVLNPTELEELDFLRADITEDGEINIGDITKISKVISGVGTDSKQAKAYRTKSQQASEDAVTVSVSSTGANTYRLALSLDNSVAYAGAQMDIVLPAGATLLNESLASRASSHKLYSSDIDGIHRIVISSADVATFADGDKALVYLDVAVSGNAKAEEVVVTNIVMADANAYTYKMKSVNGNFDGTVGIEDDVTVDNEGGVRQKIYDVSGALIKKLQKGINIIRNSDGTVKKVFKK